MMARRAGLLKRESQKKRVGCTRNFLQATIAVVVALHILLVNPKNADGKVGLIRRSPVYGRALSCRSKYHSDCGGKG